MRLGERQTRVHIAKITFSDPEQTVFNVNLQLDGTYTLYYKKVFYGNRECLIDIAQWIFPRMPKVDYMRLKRLVLRLLKKKKQYKHTLTELEQKFYDEPNMFERFIDERFFDNEGTKELY